MIDDYPTTASGGFAMYHLQASPLPTLWTVVIHVVMLLLAIGAIFAAYRRSQQPPSAIDIFVWLVGTGFINSLAAAMVDGSPEYALSFIYRYITFIWAVAIFGCALCFVRWSSRNHKVRTGITDVVNSLVLITSLGVIIALLLPTVPHAPPAGKRTECKNHLKQIGLAFHNYESQQGQFPASTTGDPPASWRITILPLLDRSSIYEAYHLDMKWDSEPNTLVAKQLIADYSCPAWRYNSADEQGRFYTAYGMLTGDETAGHGPKTRDFQNNLSSTIVIFEACGLNLVWTKPNDIDTTTHPVGINLPSPVRKQSPGWGSSLHQGGTHVLLADGSVRFLSEKIAEQALKGLTTLDNSDDPAEF